MNRQNLISVLQSRIAKRKYEITSWWKRYSVYKIHTSQSAKTCAERVSIIARELGVLQKQDKTILKQIYADTNRQETYENTLYRMDNEIHKLRRQLASYKLTGMPYVSGNAN